MFGFDVDPEPLNLDPLNGYMALTVTGGEIPPQDPVSNHPFIPKTCRRLDELFTVCEIYFPKLG
jgi:hypothetical protein